MSQRTRRLPIEQRQIDQIAERAAEMYVTAGEDWTLAESGAYAYYATARDQLGIDMWDASALPSKLRDRYVSSFVDSVKTLVGET